ncbi:MAG: polyprenyl synthetase family protein, partial [Pseudomonadota bacterium]
QSLEISRAKTASLFSTACFVGAWYANQDEQIAGHLAQYGNDMGMAFQLWDDVLDYTGDPKIMGKANGSDLREGRKTLPLLFALQCVSAADRRTIQDTIGKQDASEDAVRAVCTLIAECGAFTQVQKRARTYADSAIAHLDCLSQTPARDALVELCEFAITRDQ